MNVTIETQAVSNTALLVTISQDEDDGRTSCNQTFVTSEGTTQPLDEGTIELVGDQIIYPN